MTDRARKSALTALDSVFKDLSYSNLIIDKFLDDGGLNALDRSFASALFYGVLDRKITLDYILSKYIKNGLQKTDITVLNAMRLALYQIMYMDKVPDSAAVNESVNLIKASKKKYAASFVNGVLRNILRNDIALPEGDSSKALSVRYSCSEYIVKELISDYGTEETKKFLESSLLPPTVYLKVNTVKISAEELVSRLKEEGITASLCDTENAVAVEGGIDVASSKCYKEGLFHVEDLACQKAVAVFGAKPEEIVLDMCSAPGGKSFSMAEDMENRGEIIACDIYKSRTDLIKRGAARLGLDIIVPTLCKPDDYGNLGTFDAVLCDVPCSGYGVIGRKPEIKYKPENDFKELSQTQFNILSNADMYLKPGGRLMYSTCTLRKAENGDVVRRFLDKYASYKLKYEHTFFPHTDGTDGFYCALLEKR